MKEVSLHGPKKGLKCLSRYSIFQLARMLRGRVPHINSTMHTSRVPHINVPRPSKYLLTLRMCNKITRGSESFTPHADAVCSCDTQKQTHNKQLTKQQSTLKGQDARLNYKDNPQSTELPAQTVELRTYMFPKY